MAKKFSGVTGRMLQEQAEARARMRARHAKERQASASYGKRTERAKAAREKMARRQALEMHKLLSRQEDERLNARAAYSLRGKNKNWNQLRNEYAMGNVSAEAFKTENLRYALLNNHGLKGADADLFEDTVKKMSPADLMNLSKMYKNVLETWKDSSGYFEAISGEVVQRIKGMAHQTTKNISRMLSQGDSDIDSATVELALTTWNFRLKSKRETMEAIGFLLGK